MKTLLNVKTMNVKTSIGLFASVLLIMLASCEANEEPLANEASQNEVKLKLGALVWSDEFNYTGLPDTQKWGNEIGHIRGTELQYYTARSQNQYVSNGTLKVTARQESYGGYGYTSASLTTDGIANFSIGKRIEARIKLPSFTGQFPAFWLLGANISTYGWPACGEIDIMEQLNTSNTIYGTTHWDNNAHLSSSGSTTTSYANWHVYAVEWSTSAIKWYVDGRLYKTFSIAGAPNGTWELTQPMFIILNLAVGGDWPGHTVNNSLLPASMEVDYVRVYNL